MLVVSPGLVIPAELLEERFVRADGPGGQNVNKVASAVQLRFDVAACTNLAPEVRERLRRLAGQRMTDQGILQIDARRFRSQERNREDARERLRDLVVQALHPPVPRRPTRPTLASQQRRLAGKRRRSRLLHGRRQRPDADD